MGAGRSGAPESYIALVRLFVTFLFTHLTFSRCTEYRGSRLRSYEGGISHHARSSWLFAGVHGTSRRLIRARWRFQAQLPDGVGARLLIREWADRHPLRVPAPGTIQYLNLVLVLRAARHVDWVSSVALSGILAQCSRPLSRLL